ncbi:DUF3138 family protein [Paraburkholderia sp. EG287B]|uniref:DUF3138 family protein n=1 Tax=unclassified Paraburkholderia TaxID=2615204 RepID=UPI0034D1BEBB
MRWQLICLIVSGTVPCLAIADPISARIEGLQQELKALQAEVESLKAELAAKPPAVNTPHVVDASKPGYGNAPARLTNDDLADMKQQLASQQLKVDSLSDAATSGPLAGLSVTGYIDPAYVYNRAARTSSFLFANHESSYTYFNSTIGDVYLNIKKTFGVGPMAPSAEFSLMPNRGNGISLLANEHGNIGNNILNTAFVTVPLSGTTTFLAGLMSAFGGYEYQLSTQTLTLTHNLLYDFSDPAAYVGVGLNYTPEASNWSWKFMLGNEQARTYGAVTQTGQNALGDPVTTSNRVPSFAARADYTWSTALDTGGSFTIGRQTLPSAHDPVTGRTVFGAGGQASSSGGYFVFGELDATYTLADAQFNAEADYGKQQRAAFNGGNAQWYGVSLLAHRKFSMPVVGRMGATARYDFLVNSQNGGGGGGIFLNGNGMDPYNGFGIGADCLANSKANGGLGFECKGAVRQDVALNLLFYPTQQITVKVEYRHDWANNQVFLRNDGSYAKANDLFAMQFIYAF